MSERITKGIEEAMKAETDGYHFYLMAAQSTTDEKGREVFQQLAQEELAHLRFLMGQRDAMKETGRVDRSLTLGKQADRAGESPIFSVELRGRAREAHFEMTALSIGIQLELQAQKFYRAQAQEATDGEVKAFFNELADWEAGHYDALSRQQSELKDDYWSGGGFTPW